MIMALLRPDPSMSLSQTEKIWDASSRPGATTTAFFCVGKTFFFFTYLERKRRFFYIQLVKTKSIFQGDNTRLLVRGKRVLVT